MAEATVEKRDALYDACYVITRSHPDKLAKSFTQEELLDFNVLSTTKELLAACQELMDRNLMRMMQTESRKTVWCLRTREMGQKISVLTGEERAIYAQIEASYTSGLWIRALKAKTKLPPNTVTKIIKTLEQKALIKGIKSVKAPAQRTYMLAHLAPSEDVIGGSWYSDGDLDTGLITEVGNLIIFHVGQSSWAEGKNKPRIKHERVTSPAVVVDDAPTTNGSKKRKASHTNDIEEPPTKQHKKRSRSSDPETDISTPFAPGRTYPTTAAIHTFITNAGILDPIKSSSLTVAEVQDVINVLVWDERLEKVGEGYRTVMGTKMQQDMHDDFEDAAGTGLTQSPCGGCPVFDLCGKGGPVSADNCVYYARWLEV